MYRHRPDPPPAPSPSASAAWARVTVFASAVEASMDKWLADTHRVGLTEYRALTFINQTSDKEMRVNELAHRVGLNPSSTTRLVSRLEAKGLARRDVCTDDGRGVYAVIDEPGITLVREVRAPYEARLAELLRKPDAHFPHLDTGRTGSALTEIAALIKP